MPGPPAKWTKYSAMNEVVEGTRFVPFKTPYKEPVCQERFTPTVLMNRIGNLGFVLNLVKTDRYYNPSAYKNRNIQTFHVWLEGHGREPTPEQIDKIFSIFKTYMDVTKDGSKLIGVHCTHGVNRTGYIICRFMIEKLGFEPQDAVHRFQKARGHEFDHDEYVEALLKLRPSVDEAAKEWHSIGGTIVPRVIEDKEPALDIGSFMQNRSKKHTDDRHDDQSRDSRESDSSRRRDSESGEAAGDGKSAKRRNRKHARIERRRRAKLLKRRMEAEATGADAEKVDNASSPSAVATNGVEETSNQGTLLSSIDIEPASAMSASSSSATNGVLSVPNEKAKDEAVLDRKPSGEGHVSKDDTDKEASPKIQTFWWTGTGHNKDAVRGHHSTNALPSFGQSTLNSDK